MKLNNFAQGLNLRQDASTLAANEAVTYSNIDNAKNILASIEGYTATEQDVDNWFYFFRGVWYSSTIERDYVEYKNNLYYTQNTGLAGKVVNGQVKLLGIEAPIAKLVTVQGAAGVLHSGDTTVQYVYTFYDSIEGIESAPSTPSDELALASNHKVNISNFVTSTNPAVDVVRIYRLGADTTEFTFIVDVPLVQIIANGLTYIDNLPTLDSTGFILDTINNSAPISGLKYLTEAYGTLFAVSGTKLYFTRIGLPDAWPAENSIDFYYTLTGILPITDGMLIFTRFRTYLLTGSDATTFVKIPITREQGCISHKSCKTVKTLPTWISNNGICSYRFGVITVMSQDKLGKISLDVVNTLTANEQYYVCLSDGSLLIMDLRFGMMFKNIAFPLVTVDNIGLFDDDVLYGVIGGFVVTLFTDELVELSYTSPDLNEGDASVTKMYNNIYVRLDGKFVFKTLIDGIEVCSELLSGNYIADVKVPQELQRGSSIQFNIVGTGQINEIEYKTIGRQNGR